MSNTVPLQALLDFISEEEHRCPTCDDYLSDTYVDAHSLRLFLKQFECVHDYLEAVMVYRERIGPDDRLWECVDCDQVVDRDRNSTGITRSDLDAHFGEQ